MSSKQADPGEVLEITTRIHASRETVFRHFTDPERFGRWMGGGLGIATLDPRVGGPLRVVFPEAGGRVLVGEVQELAPPERFAFTWGDEAPDGSIPAGSTRVEIVLRELDGSTVLTLRHSGLPDAAARGSHRGGWRIYTSVLAAGAASDQHAPHLPERVASWFAAWAETDPARRHAHLEACCTDDVAFYHSYASLACLADLEAHVAVSQFMSRGVQLQPSGTPTACHDAARFAWRAVTADGQVVSSGENVARMALDGRFREVHGFRDL